MVTLVGQLASPTGEPFQPHPMALLFDGNIMIIIITIISWLHELANVFKLTRWYDCLSSQTYNCVAGHFIPACEWQWVGTGLGDSLDSVVDCSWPFEMCM